jgi:hypothetical protein
MHVKLAVTDYAQEHHCPTLFAITQFYIIHGHHLAVLADAFEYLLLVAECESWSMEAVVYLVLVAHVEDIFHYVRRFYLGSTV